jgi:hypothetical protein
MRPPRRSRRRISLTATLPSLAEFGRPEFDGAMRLLRVDVERKLDANRPVRLERVERELDRADAERVVER